VSEINKYMLIPIVRVPGDSLFHRLHPLTKLAWAVGGVTMAFATRNPLVLGVVTVVGFVLLFMSRVWHGYLRFVLMFFPLSLSLIVFQSLAPAFPRPWVPLASIGPFTIYNEGIYSGLSLLTRAYAASNFSMLLVLTTHPGDLFAALQAIGMPHEINWILMTSLQLIPVVQREFGIVTSAQRSRAMKKRGFGALLPSMVPVFAGTIERVTQLSMSLESRGFGSKGKKTSLRRVRARAFDWVMGIFGVVVAVAVSYFTIANSAALDWSEVTFMPVWLAVVLVVGSAIAFVSFTGYYIVRAARA